MSEQVVVSSDTDLSHSESAYDIRMSGSQSTGKTKRKSIGKRSENLIHNYFDYNDETDISKCKVSNCKTELRGKNSTNLVKHLRTNHKIGYEIYNKEEVQRKDKKLKTEKASTSQSLITSYASFKLSADKYEINNPIVNGFMFRLIRLVATTSVPISIVEKQEFRDLIWFLNERIPIPARKGLINECLNYFNKSKQEIISKFENIDTISLGADIWSKKGLTESYLGISAYFYDKTNESKAVLTLALKLFPHPHKAENIRDIFQSVLTEYGIKHENIFRVITDNGSNMVKTFKIEWKDDEDSDDFDYYSKEENLDYDIEDIEEDINENEFDFEESELDTKFSECKIQRIGCFIHILQCVIKVCNKTTQFKEVLRSVTKLINKFRQSGKMTEILKHESGSVLPTITITR